MKTGPLRYLPKPGYPLKKELLEHPELLYTLPQRWQKSAAAGAAAGLAAAMLFSGCTGLPAKDTSSAAQCASALPSVSETLSAAPPPKLQDFPFFEHGDGRGSFGCVSVAPAVYFTEAEAYQVICETAKTFGVDFSDTKKSYSAKIPKTSTLPGDIQKEPAEADRGNIILDGYDGKKGIGFEFVSVEDFDAWRVNQEEGSTVSYNMLKAARQLNGYFNKDGVPAAVFHEPFASVAYTAKKSYEELEAILHEKNIAYLKQQVSDFMQWLKCQGII